MLEDSKISTWSHFLRLDRWGFLLLFHPRRHPSFTPKVLFLPFGTQRMRIVFPQVSESPTSPPKEPGRHPRIRRPIPIIPCMVSHPTLNRSGSTSYRLPGPRFYTPWVHSSFCFVISLANLIWTTTAYYKTSQTVYPSSRPVHISPSYWNYSKHCKIFACPWFKPKSIWAPRPKSYLGTLQWGCKEIKTSRFSLNKRLMELAHLLWTLMTPMSSNYKPQMAVTRMIRWCGSCSIANFLWNGLIRIHLPFEYLDRAQCSSSSGQVTLQPLVRSYVYTIFTVIIGRKLIPIFLINIRSDRNSEFSDRIVLQRNVIWPWDKSQRSVGGHI